MLGSKTSASETTATEAWPSADAVHPLAEQSLSLDPASVAALVRPLPATERIKVIHDWVVLTLRYESGHGVPQSPSEVLRRGTASCEGYAGLVEALGSSAGLEVVTIHGLFAMPDGPPQPHAWNAVRLDGRWQLLDATLDDPTVRGAGDERRAFRTDYFLIPPEVAQLDHWPFEGRWQLTSSRPSREAFEHRPRSNSPSLLKAGLELLAGPTEHQGTTQVRLANRGHRFVLLALDGQRCGPPTNAPLVELDCPRRAPGARLELLANDEKEGLFLTVHEFSRGP
jgi:hypothetical protein